MKNYQKGFAAIILIIAILAILVVGGGLYYYYKTHWKSYNNTKYGFVFQYPANFDVYTNNYTVDGVNRYDNQMRHANGNENIISVGKIGLIGKNKNEALFTISIQPNTGNKYQTTEQVISTYLKVSEKTADASKNTQINTREGRKMIEIVYPDTYTMYMFIENNNFYTVTAFGSNAHLFSESERELTRRILSTIVFN